MLALGAGWTAACFLPTDKSDALLVRLDDVPELIVNDVTQLTATLVRDNGDTIRNATFRFASDSAEILAVSPDGEARALGRGAVIVTAEAVDFEGATPDARLTQVQGLVQIDSILPVNARVGDLVQIFGIGLADSLPGFTSVAADSTGGPIAVGDGLTGQAPDSAFTYFPPLLTFNGVPAPIAAYRAESARHFGRGVLTAWVPLSGDQPLARVRTLRGEATADPGSGFTVDRRDVLEPNDAAPANLGQNPSRFFPALSSEAAGVDWYLWNITGAGTVGAVLRWVGPGPDSVLFGSSVVYSAGTSTYGSLDWLTGTGFTCDGLAFRPELRARRDSLIVSVQDAPAGPYHLLVFSGQPLTYSLQTTPAMNAALAPDGREEDDACPFAQPLTITSPQTLELTIDHAGDVDWFRITIPAGQTGDLIARATSLAAASDLDLYLLQDFTPDSLPVLQAATRRAQATEVLLQTAGAGNYYLVVVDFSGDPTDYDLEVSFSPAPTQARRAP